MRHFLFMRYIVIILVAAFVAELLMFAGFGVKMLLRRNGEFKRHCASRDPYTGESSGCVCAKKSVCNDKPAYNPLDVNQNLMDEV
jgi:hypothetical protein